MKTSSQFNINGETKVVNLTDKAKGIEAFSVKGVRWFQKSYGNTYHKSYISALVDGRWIDLGVTEMQYGYDDHYLVSAGKWLIKNGFVECESGYFLSNRSVRDDFAVDHTASDVDRKRDL